MENVAVVLEPVPKAKDEGNTGVFLANGKITGPGFGTKKPKSTVMMAAGFYFEVARRLVSGGGVCGRSR